MNWAASSFTSMARGRLFRSGPDPGTTSRPCSSPGSRRPSWAASWLLDRWAELRTLIERQRRVLVPDPTCSGSSGCWASTAMRPSHDPALNALFLAWDVMAPGVAANLWKRSMQRDDPCATRPATRRRPGASSARGRPTRPRRSSASAAVIDERVARLDRDIAELEQTAE